MEMENTVKLCAWLLRRICNEQPGLTMNKDSLIDSPKIKMVQVAAAPRPNKKIRLLNTTGLHQKIFFNNYFLIAAAIVLPISAGLATT
jgi:hypothetical protein